MKKAPAHTLAAVMIFQDLDIEDRQRLAEQVFIRTYGRSEQVLARDDMTTEVFFVISGEVRATAYSAKGKEVDFQDLGPGEMFGELAAIDQEPRSTHVVSLVDSLIATMSQQAFLSALATYPSVNRRTMVRLTRLVRMHCERIFEFSTLGVKNRIHAELLRLARDVSDGDGPIEVLAAPTHAEIASRVATHREAVARECSHLTSLGLIDWRAGRHVINDVAALERLVRDVRGH